MHIEAKDRRMKFSLRISSRDMPNPSLSLEDEAKTEGDRATKEWKRLKKTTKFHIHGKFQDLILNISEFIASLLLDNELSFCYIITKDTIIQNILVYLI
jgi:hypothetical protein